MIESFGGAGYIEDTHLPALLRNAQVLAIWEGTTNVLSLDVFRAIKKEAALEGFLQESTDRLGSVTHAQLQTHKADLLKAQQRLSADFIELAQWSEEETQSVARTTAFNLARVYAGILLLEQAQWELSLGNPHTQLVLERWLAQGVYEALPNKAQYQEKTALILGV